METLRTFKSVQEMLDFAILARGQRVIFWLNSTRGWEACSVHIDKEGNFWISWGVSDRLHETEKIDISHCYNLLIGAEMLDYLNLTTLVVPKGTPQYEIKRLADKTWKPKLSISFLK